MNRIEFTMNVLPGLRAMFDSIDRWVARLEKDGNAEAAYDVWVRKLSPFTAEQVIAAADKLMDADDGKKYPEKADGFLRRLRAICYEGRPRELRPPPSAPDGQATYACNLCQDRGVVIVFWEWRCGVGTYQTCAVACDRCEKGSKMDNDTVRYRQGHMVDWDFQEEQDRMKAAAEAAAQRRIEKAQEVALAAAESRA